MTTPAKPGLRFAKAVGCIILAVSMWIGGSLPSLGADRPAVESNAVAVRHAIKSELIDVVKGTAIARPDLAIGTRYKFRVTFPGRQAVPQYWLQHRYGLIWAKVTRGFVPGPLFVMASDELKTVWESNSFFVTDLSEFRRDTLYHKFYPFAEPGGIIEFGYYFGAKQHVVLTRAIVVAPDE